ncbi:glycosyltransferase family 4 protein [Microbulbifer marinus]|uniref:Glycosyltransferase involved in cell wall bisynthesis n=1 Tax=Microbulbifer marinus TaxID=658218 RepID=A0A1H4ADL1_9GAMM|nr:glycosyltransferase family 4 protein [Microbulbifer marinus]SEA34010.1 Glycosyltransferase involved in cell wall bisynthesis [Microbulbifer marinus]
MSINGSMKQKINLMVGTNIRGMGGIASVLNVYHDAGFFSKWNVRLIRSHGGADKVGRVRALLLYAFSLIKITMYLIFRDVGIVHVHMASRGSYLRKSIVVRLAKFFGSKVVVHLHGAEFRKFYSEECSLSRKAHILRTFEMASAVVVLSSQWAVWVRNLLINNKEHVRVIYNSVPELRLDEEKKQAGLVVFMGRIGTRKGTLDLLYAFAKVRQACPEATLVLAGDGDISACRDLVTELGLTDSVNFCGWISGKDKLELLSKADIYCLPSYNEGLPMGILEAMSAGVPVVASRAGGIPDAITHMREGILIEAGDIDGLERALTDLIRNRELNRRLAEFASIKYTTCFSIEAVIPQLNGLYSELLNEAD